MHSFSSLETSDYGADQMKSSILVQCRTMEQHSPVFESHFEMDLSSYFPKVAPNFVVRSWAAVEATECASYGKEIVGFIFSTCNLFIEPAPRGSAFLTEVGMTSKNKKLERSVRKITPRRETVIFIFLNFQHLKTVSLMFSCN